MCKLFGLKFVEDSGMGRKVSCLPVVMFVIMSLGLRGTCAKYSTLGLTASPVDSDPFSIHLTWEYPAEGPLIQEHGVPKYFSITYSLANAFGCRTVPNATDYNSRQLDGMHHRAEKSQGKYTLKGLLPNSVYYVYVQARTPSHTYPESSIVAMTNEMIPKDAPTGLRLMRNESSATSLRLVWDDVPCTAGSRSSQFIGFRYNLTLDGCPVGDPQETISAGVLLTDLKPYTKYGFRVQIKSAEGYGPYSEPFNGVTMGEEVSLTQTSEVAYGETAEFVCCCRGGRDSASVPDSDSVVLKGPDGPVQRSSSTASGLTRTNHFRVIVNGPKAKFTCTLHYKGFDDMLGTAAINAILYEKPHLFTPPTAVIGDPSPGNATVRWLQWTADGRGDGPVNYQEVVWRRVGDFEYNNIAIQSGSVSTVISGLDEDGEYEFAVVLFRKGVPGPPNKAIVTEAVTTPTVAPSVKEKTTGKKTAFHNLHGPEEDNTVIAAVCMGMIAFLIFVSVVGVWCMGRGGPSGEHQAPLTKHEP